MSKPRVGKLNVARQALDESAQRAVDILESITDAFVCLDHEWHITYVNQGAARLTNLSPEEILGKSRQEMHAWLRGGIAPGGIIATVIDQTYQRLVTEQSATHFERFDERSNLWLEIHAYPCKVGFSIYFRVVLNR